MKKLLKYIIAIVLIVIVYAYFTIYPKLDIVSGFSAKSIASHQYIANRNKTQTEKEDNNIPSMNLATNTINEKEKSINSKVWVFKKRTAKFKNGLGTILIPYGKENEVINIPQPRRNKQLVNKPYPFGHLPAKDSIFTNVDYSKIEKSLEYAFKDTHKTRSVLVIYKDHIIAEKYASNFDKNSIFLGWSMAKSVTSAIVGILEKQGKVNLEQKNLFNEWKDDDRKNITLKNLLNMNSGLAWTEDYDNISDVTKMLFLDENMSLKQKNKQFVGKPNETWNYSSGTTNLISGFIRNQFKSEQNYLDFWYAALIDKIGMHSMLVESDYSGTLVGSSYAWATARDWAKFGLLYLHNGNWNNEQIINKSWVDFTREPTNTSKGEYGGHFWLNAGGIYPDVPKDLFSCNGYQGQRVFIIPSKDLVIVRTGLVSTPIFDSNIFLSGIINSLK